MQALHVFGLYKPKISNRLDYISPCDLLSGYKLVLLILITLRDAVMSL